MNPKTGQWRVVELKNIEVKPLRFISAEVPMDAHIPFALVRYVVYGEPDPKHGLRLDMHKRVFLDHFDDKSTEESAAQAVPKIIEAVRFQLAGG